MPETMDRERRRSVTRQEYDELALKQARLSGEVDGLRMAVQAQQETIKALRQTIAVLRGPDVPEGEV